MKVDINLIGQCLERAQLTDKYNLYFDKDAIISNINRMTNQIWKLIPMRENNEDWSKQLNTVIIEIAGLGEIFLQDSLLLQLLSKLEGISVVDVEFDLYRKTIFESIGLIQQFKELV